MAKLAYRYHVDVETLLALRMACSTPFFLLLAVWVYFSGGRRTFSLRDGIIIAILGVIGGYLPMWLDFAGLRYVSAGLERIILFLYPTMVVILSAFWYRQHIGRREILALIISYGGVIMVVGHDVMTTTTDSGQMALGAMLVFASALLYAGYLVCCGRIIPRVGSAAFTAYSMLMASATSGLHFAATDHQASILNLPAAVYQIALLMAVIATVLPALLLNIGIQRIGSNRAALVSSIGPVSTIVLAYVFLDEPVTGLQMAGAALVISGVLLITTHKAPA